MDFLNEKIIENKIDYDEFIKDSKYDLKEYTFDEQTISFWKSRNFYTQMMDVWGEVDKARNYYIKWKNANTEDKEKRFSALLKSLKSVRECLAIVKENNNFTEPVKQTFRIAEWELYDFFFGIIYSETHLKR